MRTVALILGANPIDSKVLVDGLDITDMCTGVEVVAHIGEPTQITLCLIAHCSLLADAPKIEVVKEEREEGPRGD